MPRQKSISPERMTAREIAIGLFILGLSQNDIAQRSGISQPTISKLIVRENWESIRQKVLTERQILLTKESGKTQEFIRGVELELGRKLMGAAEQALRNLKVENPTVRDCVELVRLASEVSRLGAGMPLAPVEVNVTHNLSDELSATINKVYGSLPEPDKVETARKLNAPIDIESIE